MAARDDARETAIRTFAECTEMTERQARAFVLRELGGLPPDETARELGGIDRQGVATLVREAKDALRAPRVAKLYRRPPGETGDAEGSAVECVFENGAVLRYVWKPDAGRVVEQTTRRDDPEFVRETGVGTADATEADLDEFMTAALELYTVEMDYDLHRLASDWAALFEAVTCYRAERLAE